MHTQFIHLHPMKKRPCHYHHHSPAKRRDHLHLLKRRKSRARLLNQEERAKLLHFRKFFIHSNTPPPVKENGVDNSGGGYRGEGSM